MKKVREKLNIDEDTFIIFSNRNIKPLYGIHYLIECIPKVVEKRKNVKFILLRGAGIIEYENKLRSRINELQMEKYIHFIIYECFYLVHFGFIFLKLHNNIPFARTNLRNDKLME